MHTETAQAVQLLHEASGVLTDATSRLEALEQRMGMNAESHQDEHPTDPPAERKRDPWLWVWGANTKQYRHELREAGGRWSAKKQSWYFINCTELPPHLASIPGTETKVTY